MNLFKKTTATVALVTLVSGIFSAGVSANSTSEIDAANALAAAGYINNHSDDTAAYNLNQNVLRQEIAAVARGIAGLDKKASCDNTFADVSATTPNNWACYSVEALSDANLIAKNTNFNPEANITKAEAVAMMVKATFPDYAYDASKSTSWQEQVVSFAVSKGIVSSFTNYDTAATRGFVFDAGNEAMIATSNVADNTTTTCDPVEELLGLCGGNADTTATDTTATTATGTTATDTTATDTTATDTTATDTTPVVVNSPALELTLSPSTTAKSVPYKGTVNFGSFDFTAGSEDTTINSIKLTRTGLGNRSDFTRVWMEKDGVRVSGRQTVGSDESVYITFSPAYVIKAGETQTLDLVAALNASTTGSQHSFTINSASDIDSSVSVEGIFPISTPTMTTANYTVVPVAYRPVSSSSSTYRLGDTNVELGQFKIENGATNDKSVTFKSIALRNEGNGNMSANLSNLAIYNNGVKVSTDAVVDGRYVTFTLNSLVDFWRTETYYIRGDVNNVELTAGDTYKLTLRYSNDLIIDETSTGFRSSIWAAVSGWSVSTAYTKTPMSKYTVSGSDIILSKSTTVSSQTVAPGTNEVTLLAADLKVNQDITLENLNVSSTMSWTALYNTFSSLKLMIGNNIVSTYTPAIWTSTGFTFEGSATVSSNTTLKIIGNVKTNANPWTITFWNIAITDFGIKEYASNGNTVANQQMVGSANGVATTIGSATLVMTRNDGIANQSVTVGSTSQTLTKFSMRANDVSDVTVSKLKFALTGSTVNTSNITNVKLLVDGSVVSTKNMSTGNADFNDININVAKNSDVEVEVVADFSTAIAVNKTLKLTLSSIEARDSNSITLTGGSITNPSDGVQYTFAAAGSASLALNSSTPSASILTPSVSETELSRFTLGAQNDSLKLTDLYVYNTGSADLSSSIKSIWLYDINGNKLAGGSVLGTSTVQFALGSTSTFVIPKNTSNSVVIVKAAFNDVTDNAQSNKSIQLAIGYASGISPVSGTGTGGVRLVSESTGDNVTSFTGNAVSNSHLLVRSKPTVAINGSATASTHTFTVTADANNRLLLDGTTFSITNPSNTAWTFKLYKDQEIAGNVIGTGTISSTGAIAFTTNSFVQTEISAGTSKTFIFKVSANLQSATVNSKRIFRVEDIAYTDVMNTGNNVSISSISAYSNVGLPSVESTFTY